MYVCLRRQYEIVMTYTHALVFNQNMCSTLILPHTHTHTHTQNSLMGTKKHMCRSLIRRVMVLTIAADMHQSHMHLPVPSADLTASSSSSTPPSSTSCAPPLTHKRGGVSLQLISRFVEVAADVSCVRLFEMCVWKCVCLSVCLQIHDMRTHREEGLISRECCMFTGSSRESAARLRDHLERVLHV